jgi:hypothetical protein
MDAEKNFLNGIIEVHGRDSRVCRINKSSYGLKQAPRA